MPCYSRSNRQDVDNQIERWPQDETGILDGYCSFHVDYLGSVEVSNPTDSDACRESYEKLYLRYKNGTDQSNSAILWITGYELRIVEQNSKNLILAEIMENIILCASNINRPDQFFYTCNDTYNNRFLCRLFVIKVCSTVRLCRALGFAFRVCLRRKVIREGLALNTFKNSRCVA